MESSREVSSAVILAGGFGTRLKSVCSDRPKAMMPVLDRPFLDYLVEYLCRQGIRNITISTGYRGDQIESFFSGERKGSVSIRCVREKNPLGTGGALSFGAQRTGSQGYVLACNGDSLVPFSMPDLEAAVRSGADAAMVAFRTSDCSRFGSLAFDSSWMLTAFAEKCSSRTDTFINAGIYLIDSRMLPKDSGIEAASIERDYFPTWLSEGRKIKVIPSDGPFIDIGTPESLEKAADFIKSCGLFRLG
jgi:D-glycero-alpha-D-manno-heptose 1-phosphate guanylyltransferase